MSAGRAPRWLVRLSLPHWPRSSMRRLDPGYRWSATFSGPHRPVIQVAREVGLRDMAADVDGVVGADALVGVEVEAHAEVVDGERFEPAHGDVPFLPDAGPDPEIVCLGGERRVGWVERLEVGRSAPPAPGRTSRRSCMSASAAARNAPARTAWWCDPTARGHRSACACRRGRSSRSRRRRRRCAGSRDTDGPACRARASCRTGRGSPAPGTRRTAAARRGRSGSSRPTAPAPTRAPADWPPRRSNAAPRAARRTDPLRSRRRGRATSRRARRSRPARSEGRLFQARAVDANASSGKRSLVGYGRIRARADSLSPGHAGAAAFGRDHTGNDCARKFRAAGRRDPSLDPPGSSGDSAKPGNRRISYGQN